MDLICRMASIREILDNMSYRVMNGLSSEAGWLKLIKFHFRTLSDGVMLTYWKHAKDSRLILSHYSVILRTVQ